MRGLPKRFRVRTLLMLVLVVGVPLGLWKRARNEKLAVEEVYAALGKAGVEVSFPRHEPTMRWKLAEMLGVSYRDTCHVHLSECDIDDTMADLINRLPQIEHFQSFMGAHLDLRRLHARPECRTIVFQGEHASVDFTRLPTTFPEVDFVCMLRVALNEEEISALAELRRLKDVEIYGNAISETSIDSLGTIPHLRYLKLSHVSPAGFEKLRSIETLESLVLNADELPTGALRSLASLPRLTALELWRCAIPDASELTTLPNLQRLNLHGTSFDHEDLRHLATLKNLKELTLSSYPHQLTKQDAAHFLELPHLRSLSMVQSNCTEGFLVALLRHPTLEELDLFASKLTWDKSHEWPEESQISKLSLGAVERIPRDKKGAIEQLMGERVSFSTERLAQ